MAEIIKLHRTNSVYIESSVCRFRENVLTVDTKEGIKLLAQENYGAACACITAAQMNLTPVMP